MNIAFTRMSISLASAFLLATGLAAGAGEPQFELTSYTVDGGGGSSTGGGYELIGTAGQPEAGPTLSSAGYEVSGGFWRSVAAAADIPTLSQWGMIAMASLVLIAGAVVLRRRRATAA